MTQKPEEMGREEVPCYVIAAEWHGDYALWWKPERCGYTNDLSQAGLYTLEEATSIERMRGTERKFLLSEAQALAFPIVRAERLR